MMLDIFLDNIVNVYIRDWRGAGFTHGPAHVWSDDLVISLPGA